MYVIWWCLLFPTYYSKISVGFVETLAGTIVTFVEFDIPLMSYILDLYIYTPFEKYVIPSQTKQPKKAS